MIYVIYVNVIYGICAIYGIHGFHEHCGAGPYSFPLVFASAFGARFSFLFFCFLLFWRAVGPRKTRPGLRVTFALTWIFFRLRGKAELFAKLNPFSKLNSPSVNKNSSAFVKSRQTFSVGRFAVSLPVVPQFYTLFSASSLEPFSFFILGGLVCIEIQKNNNLGAVFRGAIFYHTLGQFWSRTMNRFVWNKLNCEPAGMNFERHPFELWTLPTLPTVPVRHRKPVRPLTTQAKIKWLLVVP